MARRQQTGDAAVATAAATQKTAGLASSAAETLAECERLSELTKAAFGGASQHADGWGEHAAAAVGTEAVAVPALAAAQAAAAEHYAAEASDFDAELKDGLASCAPAFIYTQHHAADL